MATKHSNAFSSENDDSYSTYSEDFENDSRSPTPDNRKRYNIGNKRIGKHDLLSSEGTSSSIISTHHSAKKSTQSERQRRSHKFKTSATKYGYRSTSFSKDTKRTNASLRPDNVHARMLSAQKNRINILNNELSETQLKLEDLVKENRLLKTLQHRQDKALRKFEDTESDLPRMISQHMEDQRILKARLRKSQDSERRLEAKLRDSNDELQKMENTLRRLKKIVYDKNLGERSELAKQLHAAEDKAYEYERKNKELEKKLELTTQSFARQVNGERAKHRETKERLEVLHDEFLSVQTRLKEKERALEVSNIYALRVKQSPEKSFVGGKVAILSPRRPPQKSPVKTDPSPLPIATTTQAVATVKTPEHPKEILSEEQTAKNIFFTSNEEIDDRKTLKSPLNVLETEREDSALLDLGNPNKAQHVTKGLNGFRLDDTNNAVKLDRDQHDTKPSRSVFLTANFESPMITPNATFISEDVGFSTNTDKSFNSNMSKFTTQQKSDLMTELNAKKKEEELEKERKKMEEDRRKKAALLAKMRDLEDDGSSSLGTGGNNQVDDIRKLLGPQTKPENRVLAKQERVHDSNPTESFESKLMKKLREDCVNISTKSDLDSQGRALSNKRSKKLYKFPVEVENLHKGIPSASDFNLSQPNKSEPEISFGSYAPTVASPPKRKPRTQTMATKKVNKSPSDSESDEPLLDIITGKSKKSDLLQQLFGEQAGKQGTPNGPAKKEKSFTSSREPSLLKTTPRAKPVHTGYPWERNVVPASQQGNGDSGTTKIFGAPAVKAVPSFNEDDIEEVTL